MDLKTNINDFANLILNAPQGYKDLFRDCVLSLERVDYHPEALLSVHIFIVYLNAVERGGNPNLKMASLLHDVCKPCTGLFKTVQIGPVECRYWSNPYHAHQAAKLIEENERIQQWIVDNGADIETVRIICKEHMKFKSFVSGEKGLKGGMKETKRIKFAEKYTDYMPLIREFNQCDNMLDTFERHPDWFKIELIAL
jgi:hypothetical protein